MLCNDENAGNAFPDVIDDSKLYLMIYLDN